MCDQRYKLQLEEIQRILLLDIDELYEILKVGEGAGNEEIIKSCRKIGMLVHPDKNGNSADSTLAFQKLKAAERLALAKEAEDCQTPKQEEKQTRKEEEELKNHTFYIYIAVSLIGFIFAGSIIAAWLGTRYTFEENIVNSIEKTSRKLGIRYYLNVFHALKDAKYLRKLDQLVEKEFLAQEKSKSMDEANNCEVDRKCEI